MKRNLIIVAAVALLALGGWWGYGRMMASSTAAREKAAALTPQPGAATEFVSASGKLLPVHWAGLSPAVAGTISAVYVAEGDLVEAGRVLIDLDNGVLKSQVAISEANLAEAEAGRNKLIAGAAPEDITAARADVAAAQGSVAQAEAALQEIQQSVAVSQAQVGITEAQYRELASHPTQAERVAAMRQIELTAAVVKAAQRSYDLVLGDPGLASRPEAVALEQATVNHNSAKAAYDAATQGATPQQLAVAQAQIVAAKAQLGVASGRTPAAQAAVQSANAGLARAQAALARIIAGATAEDRIVADARVKSAQAEVAMARSQLAQAQVSAPFAGQVGAIPVRVGELATPGQSLLVLGDTTHMRVETTDLRESDVTPLKVGMAAEVTFDALPNRSFTGRVSRIAVMSNVEKGSTNYTVVVELDQSDPALRWGMTAFVNVPTH
jgi:HlyD family secretion protein